MWAAGARLGEGPLWSPVDQRLHWVDILAREVHSCAADGARRTSLKVPDTIGCLALRRDGGAIAGLGRAVAYLDLESGAVELVATPEEDAPNNRFNDGKCDRRGRFWAGTMDRALTHPTGTLYRIDDNLRVTAMVSGFVVTNGIGWSPDDRTLYVTDTVNRQILAFDFDRDSGDISGRRVFARIPDSDGFPDGLTVSADGDVWSAHWDGWRITRYAPGGAIRQVIRMPVPRPTSCTFGGSDLRTLYVTSAADGLADDALATAPLSGALFAVPTDTVGIPEARFAG
ncbi:MAG: SMP-30/gluconolactonase/LRE family protein [Proteobacteria bacterium]|nr:SMP-30/gluconolactonase/LRE family protein [Pseudomonadota bacterium]MDA1131779.1 SMP-30/gluconolactonase/LRE family protein [Pseudomonadota bacterium]